VRLGRRYESGILHFESADKILNGPKLPWVDPLISHHEMAMQLADELGIQPKASVCLHGFDTHRIGTKVVQRLFGVRVGCSIGCTCLNLVQEESVEFGVGAFYLAAIDRLAPVEHVHQQVRIAGGTFDCL